MGFRGHLAVVFVSLGKRSLEILGLGGRARERPECPTARKRLSPSRRIVVGAWPIELHRPLCCRPTVDLAPRRLRPVKVFEDFVNPEARAIHGESLPDVHN